MMLKQFDFILFPKNQDICSYFETFTFGLDDAAFDELFLHKKIFDIHMVDWFIVFRSLYFRYEFFSSKAQSKLLPQLFYYWQNIEKEYLKFQEYEKNKQLIKDKTHWFFSFCDCENEYRNPYQSIEKLKINLLSTIADNFFSINNFNDFYGNHDLIKESFLEPNKFTKKVQEKWFLESFYSQEELKFLAQELSYLVEPINNAGFLGNLTDHYFDNYWKKYLD